MRKLPRRHFIALAATAALPVALGGCTKPSDYFRNGFKVGPNYCRPPAPVAQQWIEAADARVRSDSEIPCRWWTIFGDPILNDLVMEAYHQNLTLKEAGFRVLEARAQLNIAAGSLFPQSQNATGSYRRLGVGKNFFDQWNFGFNLAWELDFWGRFRRAVTAACDLLDASVANYDDVLVTLLADLASSYVQIRTDQERLALLRKNLEIETEVFQFVENRFKQGFKTSDLDYAQAASNLAQTKAQIPLLEVDMRQAADRLCTLLGIPTINILERLGIRPIPTAPADVAVGVPAELLRRRPDVRRAERQAAAQAEEIGIAVADLYPAFTISGTMNWQAAQFEHLFSPRAFNGSIGPSFNWAILNYGRIVNNVRFQDARFQELVALYQNTVLTANQEAEDGIIAFLKAQERTRLLEESVRDAVRARNVAFERFKLGVDDLNRYSVVQQTAIQQEDQLAASQGQIALGLIRIYRALGGGWELRCGPDGAMAGVPPTPPAPPQPPEEVPGPEGRAQPGPKPDEAAKTDKAPKPVAAPGPEPGPKAETGPKPEAAPPVDVPKP